MKSIFAAAMIIGFIWALPAFAWQDPCAATQYTYEYDGGYTLGNWIEEGPQFSPAPMCAGTVTLTSPDGTLHALAYIGNGDTMRIAGVPCGVNYEGDLACRIVTQPEVSTLLVFIGQE